MNIEISKALPDDANRDTIYDICYSTKALIENQEVKYECIGQIRKLLRKESES